MKSNKLTKQAFRSRKRKIERYVGGILLAVFLISCYPISPVSASPSALPTPGPQIPTPDLRSQSPTALQGPTKVYIPIISTPFVSTPTTKNWATVAANPERTSWSAEQVSGDLHVEWYRPIQAYISQNTQVIASDGMLFISTAKGLYALNAANGDLVWRFDTEMPLGNSPTVANGVVYVGGYDRKIHALDEYSGTHLWAFDGAQAGFCTNPLVVDGRVIAGNRDGYMYAIGANGTASQGKLIWKYKTGNPANPNDPADPGGPILLSAAYKNGIVYFAANDNHAYALRANTTNPNGELVWRSAKLPGDGYQSYWPVIYQDKVIFSATNSYRAELDPGVGSILDGSGNMYDNFDRFQKDDLFFDKPDTTIGPVVTLNEAWTHGNPVIDGSRLTEYLENNPQANAHLHKPWRRVSIILNQSTGSEYTFDSDHDGYPETAPFAYWGAKSGSIYPPIIGSDNVLYQNNILKTNGQGTYDIPQGIVMGWKIGTQYLDVIGGQGADDEPQAISGGGTVIYRSLCCDRVGNYFDTLSNGNNSQDLWGYQNNLSLQAPGYDSMWWGIDPQSGFARLEGNYGTLNGIYHNHGDQNPIIPYQGRLYIHRSNAIIAYGTGTPRGKLALIQANAVQDSVTTPTLDALKARLETEIQKIIAAGLLRPGYYNAGQFSIYSNLNDYFNNPGDTLYTIAKAYPYLSPALQVQAKTYLTTEFQTYFDPVMYANIGWGEGAAREAMPLPPEAASSISGAPKSTWVGYGWPWQYPQHNFYAMWKYAMVFPGDALKIYNLAKDKVEVPANTSNYIEAPWENNAYIAGYIGFLRLQEMAGMTTQDSALRSAVTAELNRLLGISSNSFSKDNPWILSPTAPVEGGPYHYRSLNVARNFIFLVPELGTYLNQNALAKMQAAITEYSQVGPFWFSARYNGIVDEGARAPLYDYAAIFQAKAYILKESRSQLTKYLDVPAFERGDLFYIQNLIAAIEAP